MRLTRVPESRYKKTALLNWKNATNALSRRGDFPECQADGPSGVAQRVLAAKRARRRLGHGVLGNQRVELRRRASGRPTPSAGLSRRQERTKGRNKRVYEV